MNSPQRINNSVLGAWERPALAWMAARLPATVVPDQLTALGVLGALLTAASYVLSRWSLAWLYLACLGLLLNWLGDSLDGTLARLRRIERPRYGSSSTTPPTCSARRSPSYRSACRPSRISRWPVSD